MGNGSNFYRVYFILEQEDPGYGASQAPSGYVRIEAGEGAGKLLAMVQNLKDGQDRFSYRVYLLKAGKGETVPVSAGVIPIKNNSGQIHWQFNAADVDGSGYGIRDFNAAAVLVEYPDRRLVSVICPLAVRSRLDTGWKERLETAIRRRKQGAETQEKVEQGTAAAAIPAVANPIGEIGKNTGDLYNELQDSDYQGGELHDDYQGSELQDDYQDDEPRDSEYYDNELQSDELLNNMHEESDLRQETKDGDVNREPAGDIQRMSVTDLRNFLDGIFDRCDPFHSRRRDYTWWKINDPAPLNDTLPRFGTNPAVLFNSSVMMALYKYRHLILGIYSDESRCKEYIVCGVPGCYQMDERPYKAMCRWVQTESGRSRYSPFGYWLTYIDPKSGAFLALK